MNIDKNYILSYLTDVRTKCILTLNQLQYLCLLASDITA